MSGFNRKDTVSPEAQRDRLRRRGSNQAVDRDKPQAPAIKKPQRIQLRRTKGWRMPENTVKVDRTTIFGNPWTIGECGSAAKAVSMFRGRLDGPLAAQAHPDSYLGRLAAAVPTLRGKNLACWCPLPAPGAPDICHAAVLLELANAEEKK